MCVFVCGELYKGCQHIQMVVNYVNYVNMYIWKQGVFSLSLHNCAEPSACAGVMFMEREGERQFAFMVLHIFSRNHIIYNVESDH